MRKFNPGDRVSILDETSMHLGHIGTVSGHVPACVTSHDTIVSINGWNWFFSETELELVQITADAHPCDDGCLMCNNELDRHLIADVA